MKQPKARLWMDRVKTPIGVLVLMSNENGHLCIAGWLDRHERMEKPLRAYAATLSGEVEASPKPGPLVAQVRRYFAGNVASLNEIPVAFQGTDFQLEVWRALREIPAGETRTYAALARQIGRPRAIRAVGLANGANPVAVIVPCHRVIGSDGSLTGYGGGLDRKAWLLAHERATPSAQVSG